MSIVPIKGHRAYAFQERSNVNRVLASARRRGASRILVIGETDDLFVNAYPNDPAEVLWLMELAKKRLLGQ